MEIKTAEFVLSSPKVSGCPKSELYEFAFIGRSNVGKSSLINMLTEKKNLAKTSQTPGKTQLINHFIINNKWFLVDLPGYGYAKASKKTRDAFQPLITEYLTKRQNLITTFVLIDCRHEPQKIDLEFINWMGEKGLPFTLVFTKIDKLSSSELQRNLLHYKKELLKTWEEIPPVFTSSSSSNFGREPILNYIQSLLAE